MKKEEPWTEFGEASRCFDEAALKTDKHHYREGEKEEDYYRGLAFFSLGMKEILRLLKEIRENMEEKPRPIITKIEPKGEGADADL